MSKRKAMTNSQQRKMAPFNPRERIKSISNRSCHLKIFLFRSLSQKVSQVQKSSGMIFFFQYEATGSFFRGEKNGKASKLFMEQLYNL